MICLQFYTLHLFSSQCLSSCLQLTRAMRCPATKFATHCISHFLFLILLSAATFRLEENYDIHEDYNADERTVRSWLEQNFRPNKAIITHVQVCIVLWIAGTLPQRMSSPRPKNSNLKVNSMNVSFDVSHSTVGLD